MTKLCDGADVLLQNKQLISLNQLPALQNRTEPIIEGKPNARSRACQGPTQTPTPREGPRGLCRREPGRGGLAVRFLMTGVPVGGPGYVDGHVTVSPAGTS